MATSLAQQFANAVTPFEVEMLFKTQTAAGEKLLQLTELKGAVGQLAPSVNVLTETHTAASFTDGGGTSGTKVMTGSIPVGAVLLGTKVLVPAGFAGNTTATLVIGDGSDVDRYMTGTPSIFATAANGVETGVPSGNKLITTANQPTLTVTSSTDFTLVLAGGGSIVVSIYYIMTVSTTT